MPSQGEKRGQGSEGGGGQQKIEYRQGGAVLAGARFVCLGGGQPLGGWQQGGRRATAGASCAGPHTM